ncbi:MAG: phosphatase PAP2 family protein [Prevotella sp.]|nr:phosphatase PAP2 family protein [Prevotella sp.]
MKTKQTASNNNFERWTTTLLVLMIFTASAHAAVNFTGSYTDLIGDNRMELKLEAPEMKPEMDYSLAAEQTRMEQQLSCQTLTSLNGLTSTAPASTQTTSKRWSWMDGNPGVQPYRVLDDLTFVGIPVFVAGIIAKSEKNAFRQNYNSKYSNTRLITNFKTGIDDYTQYFGPAMTLGLKLGGVEGRSTWGRFLASTAMSYGLMAALVNGIKYTAKEMRPDGSTANSWPSGHTATSFVGATILHKEYGLTVSPWYSVAGYSVATATGIMRVLNNRHWVSDVLSGAGIGIMSGELAYALSDLIFKGRGLLRANLTDLTDLRENPSFFSVSMGMGLGSNDLDFDLSDGDDDYNLKFGTSTVVGVEGAYFLNKYVGIGGRLSVKSSPIKGWNKFFDVAKISVEGSKDWLAFLDEMFNGNTGITEALNTKDLTIESDHLTEFVGSAGLYFNIPLSSRFAIGSKALVGRSAMQDLDINAHSAGKVINLDYLVYAENGRIDGLYANNVCIGAFGANTYLGQSVEEALEKEEGFLDIYSISPAVDDSGNPLTYDMEWDYMTVKGSTSTSFGTGLSLSYAYKHSFTWKVFCDIDYTKKDFTLTYDPRRYLEKAIPRASGIFHMVGDSINSESFTITKKMLSWIIGASFSVSL